MAEFWAGWRFVNDEDTITASLNADLLGPDPNNSASNFSSAVLTRLCAVLYHSVALLLLRRDSNVSLRQSSFSAAPREAMIFLSRRPCSTQLGLLQLPSIHECAWLHCLWAIRRGANSVCREYFPCRSGCLTELLRHAFVMDQREVEMSFTGGSGALTRQQLPQNGNIAPPATTFYLS